MKRTIKLTVAATIALGTTSVFATNGDNLIGLGAKSRGMGGTGIAHFNGAESATANPALMINMKDGQFTFGGTYFRPQVEIETTAGSIVGAGGAQSYESKTKHSVIPYIAMANNLGNGFVIGVSMFGSAGMGTDWRYGTGDLTEGSGNGQPGLYNMRSNLMLMKFSLPMAYGQDNWSVGIAPVLMYGSLDISYDAGDGFGNYNEIGHGSSSDFGLGYEVGAAYVFDDAGITVAAKYQSAISMEYEKQISTAAGAFGYTSASVFGPYSDELEQPAEFGFGIDWTKNDLSITADYKRVQWGDAAGYKDFGWESHNVYALGFEYRMNDLALRAGYNYAENPLPNNTDSTPVLGPNTNGDTMNVFNHVMFPAVTERHYTLGAGYQFTDAVALDVAITYATSPDVTVSGATVGLGNVTVTNDQLAASANLNVAF